MKFSLLFLMLLLLLIAACKTQKKTTATAVYPPNDTLYSTTYKKVLKDRELYTQTYNNLPVDTAYISKDTLHLLTGKIQACDADNFEVLWDGKMAKSLPPKTAVKLFLQNDPACKEQHRFHLFFNLAPLRWKTDSTSHGSVFINTGHGKGDMLYSF